MTQEVRSRVANGDTVLLRVDEVIDELMHNEKYRIRLVISNDSAK